MFDMSEKKKMPSMDIGILPKNREAVCKLLAKLLADEYVLYTHALNCHWNVVGPHFGPLHKLFLENYEMLFTAVDDLAERIRTLGGTTPATLTEFLAHTQFKEKKSAVEQGGPLVADLYNNYRTVICSMRDAIRACEDQYDDIGTGNFLTDMMERHEKSAWMLRAHLE
jgi:starvation-inducible DNA-binding protein